MKKVMNLVYGVLDRVFSSKKSSSRDSRLMGMYLSQANSQKSFTAEQRETRQRQNNKYSVNREQGESLP